MPFGIPNIELPATLELPRIVDRPRPKRLDNLGRSPGGSRKGLQNKITRDLKEGLIEGAVQHGYDGNGAAGLTGYCRHIAERHPKLYCHLLAKLLPYNLNANVATATIGEVRIISVPPDHYFPKGATENNLGALEYIPPAEPITPIEPAPSQRDEAKLIAALESLSVETLERLAASLVDQG